KISPEKTNTLPGPVAGKGAWVFQGGLVASAAAKPAPATAAGEPVATVFSGSGLVDGECSPVDLPAVQGVQGRLGLLARVQLDEAEGLGAARVPVLDDLGRLDGAVRRKQVFQIAVGHAIRQVADVQLLSHDGPPSQKIHARRTKPTAG